MYFSGRGWECTEALCIVMQLCRVIDSCVTSRYLRCVRCSVNSRWIVCKVGGWNMRTKFAASSIVGRSLLPVRRPGTHCLRDPTLSSDTFGSAPKTSCSPRTTPLCPEASCALRYKRPLLDSTWFTLLLYFLQAYFLSLTAACLFFNTRVSLCVFIRLFYGASR